MHKSRRGRSRVAARDRGRGHGHDRGHSDSVAVRSDILTPIIPTPSIQDPGSSISSPPSASPAPSSPTPASAHPAQAAPNNSSTTSPSLHSSTASHLQSKNVRGGTIGKGTAAMVATVGRLKVELDYDMGRPTNDTISSELTSECGYLVRKHAPLQVESWMKIDKNERKRIRELLQFKFDIDLEDKRYVTYVNSLMSKSYSDFRHRLHNLFLEFETIEQAKQSTPPLGVKEADWLHLCDFFGTNEKYLHRSQINKQNRANVPYSHYGGSKPFVYHLQEKSKNLPEGQTQGRVDFFHDMHYHDKKGWINETAQQRYEDMHQRRSQLLEEGLETVNEDVIADEVLGTRSGYIPGMGYGPKPASYSYKRQPSPDTMALREQLLSLKDEYDSYRQQNEEQLSRLKEEYEERMSKYEEDMSQMREFIRHFMAQNTCSGDGTSFSRFSFPPPPPPPPSAAC